jgi:hypothetical protein
MADRQPRFYFFLRPQGVPTDSGYQHCLVAIAEGLRQLDVPYSSNICYWREGASYLLNADSRVLPEDCEVVITSEEYERFGTLPKSLFSGGRKTVFVDAADGWRTRTERKNYRQFNLVLRTHFNRCYRYPENVHPWAFGLTSRILAACADPKPFEQREKRMLVNFRVGQPVRKEAAEKVLTKLAARFALDSSFDQPPEGKGLDTVYWEATGRRHYPTFFERLQTTMGCAALSGYFAPGVFGSTESIAERALYKLVSRLGKRTHTIMQFDSWRFWESMAAGCLTLQVDYGRYGCCLPAEPYSGVHYAGIDFESPKSVQFLLDSDLKTLAAVACAGRQWALENYSPVVTARRLLGLLGYRN